MSARRGCRYIYARLVAPLGDDARLEVDSILGDPVATAEMQQRRRDAIAAIGGEIA